MNGGSTTAYDAPSTGGRRNLSAQTAPPSSTSAPRPRPPPIPYAAPGSSSGSMNPASTVAFMLNMGYPPPPIALESLRRLLEQMTQGPGQSLNLQSALHVTDEISRSPYRISPAVLFVIQQRLHSSKPDRVTLALELLDMCVKNCGLDFVRHINKDFMKSMSSVVKTTSFKERTITGQMKKLEKYLTGSPSSSGVATDPRVHKVRRHALTLIQNWSDAFMMHPNQIGPILDCYKALKRKGVQFPPRDTSQKYLVKHAETSPAFDASQGPPQPPETSAASVFAGESVFSSSGSPKSGDDIPFTEKQFMQLEKLIALLKSSDDAEMVQRAIAMCERLRPKLEKSMRGLTAQINSSSGKKLRGSDPRVTQLNAILDLDAEILKRRGTKLLFPVGGTEPAVPRALLGRATVSPPKAVSLLDDLLEAPDTVVRTPIEPAVELAGLANKVVDTRPHPVDHFAGLYSSAETRPSASPFDNIVLLGEPKASHVKPPPSDLGAELDAPDLFAPETSDNGLSPDVSICGVRSQSSAPRMPCTKDGLFDNLLSEKTAAASGSVKLPHQETSTVLNSGRAPLGGTVSGAAPASAAEWVVAGKAAVNSQTTFAQRSSSLINPFGQLDDGVRSAPPQAGEEPRGKGEERSGENPLDGAGGSTKKPIDETPAKGSPVPDEEIEWMSAGRSSFTDSDAEPQTAPMAAASSAPVVASEGTEGPRRASAGSEDGSNPAGGGRSRQDEEADELFGQMMAREQTRWEGNEEFFMALQKQSRIADMDTLI